MEYRKQNERLFIRLDKGDEIISALSEICEKENISFASIKGIGGCSSAVTGVFDPDKKEYNKEEVKAMLELVSLDGNVTRFEGKPYIHAHALFAYRDETGETKTLAGHLLEAVIGLTGEIFLTAEDMNVERKYVDELGIRVWKF